VIKIKVGIRCKECERGVEIERRIGIEEPREVGCGERVWEGGVWRGGCAQSAENFCILGLKIVSFGAF